jgi:hypothetical protein
MAALTTSAAEQLEHNATVLAPSEIAAYLGSNSASGSPRISSASRTHASSGATRAPMARLRRR